MFILTMHYCAATFLYTLLQDSTPAAASTPATTQARPADVKPVKFAKPRLVCYGWPDEARIPLVGDLDGDKLGDLIVLDPRGNGSLEYSRNVKGEKFSSPATTVAMPDGLTLNPIRQVVMRKREGAMPQLRIHRGDGRVASAQMQENGVVKLELEAAAAESARATEPAFAERVLFDLTVKGLPGDFDGDGALDTILDGKLTAAASPASPVEVPAMLDAPAGAKFCAGDFQGDGRDDVLVLRFDSAWRTGRDVQMYLTYAEGDTDADGDGLDAGTEANLKSDPLDADTDHDGLLDAWEVKGEGGIDLPALGASPTHKDCVVYLQRTEATNGSAAGAEIERAVKYWASLLNVNPDGKPGMHLIPIWLGVLPKADAARAWWDLGNQHLPLTARGLAHYIVVNPGGGGQSSELGDMGGCGEGALYATFLHEFGHQVGLGHSGGPMPFLCPTYTSLMNYAYSYGFNDDYNQIHYSQGALGSLVLEESKLSERVSIECEKVKFLEKGPYRFHVKADGDGALVDWNRNGRFDSGAVRADITDTYGASGGERHLSGKSSFAPTLVSHNNQLLVFAVNREKKLYYRVNIAEGKWSPEVYLTQVTPAGDPWAVSSGDRLTLFVPMAGSGAEKQVGMIRVDTPEQAATAPVHPLAGSSGCEVSAARWKDSVVCILWRGPDQPLRVVEVDKSAAISEPRDLAGLTSVMPASAVEDPLTGDLLVGSGITKREGAQEKHQWRVTQVRRGLDGGFVDAGSRIVGGVNSGWCGNSRPVLLFETSPDLGPKGRLHFMATGWTSPPNHNGCFYEAITIGDARQDDGWRLRRFYDEWTTTRSPISAVWHDNDIAIAFRWYGNVHGDEDDNLLISHHGLGIDKEPMHDFDDVNHVADVGLARSIAWRHPSVK